MDNINSIDLEMFDESDFSIIGDMNGGWVSPVPLHSHDLEPLRQRVLREVQPVLDHAANQKADKNSVRKAHSDQRKNLINDSADFILNYEDVLLPYFASGKDIDPSKIEADLVPVRTSHDTNLFRYASLQWSVPVSQGYGRRNKFLVKDRQNGKLIGIFALGDPVINLGARDGAVGWDANDRKRRLYNVFDSYVLGAVEPYRQLIGGKLMSMVAVSNETQRFITNKYSGSKIDLVNGKPKISAPALITTTSALGKSSVYNRLKYHDQPILYPVGYSSGYGHFQFSESLFDQLVELVRDHNASGIGNKFGQGPNWRFRVIKQALSILELNQNLLQHGVSREVFIAPLANNFREFLRSETDELELIDYPLGGLNEFFNQRWAIPRAERMPGFKDWKFDQWRASEELDQRKQYVQSSIFNSVSRETITSSQQPAIVDFGPFKLSIGTGKNIVEGTTITGENVQGTSYYSKLEGPGVDLVIADTEWSNGERDIQAQSLGSSNEILADVVRRQRIGIYKSPAHKHLSVMDLRCSLRLGSARSTSRKLSIDEVSTLLGIDFDRALAALPNSALSTREKLLKDSGLRRTDLAVAFPSYDRITPVVAWTLVRPLSLLAEANELPAISGLPLLTGRAPELGIEGAE